MNPSELGVARGERVILVVDDDRVYRSVTVDVLEDGGLKTLEAGSAVEALEVMAHHRVHAVLIDQVMPGMSGIELTERVRAMAMHVMTPLLFVSADDSPEIRVQALRAGATDFMIKPVVGDELVARVQAQLDLAAQWESQMDKLRARAATITEIASIAPNGSPSSTAREICDRISKSNGGRGVAILSWESAPIALAATGPSEFLAETPVVSLPSQHTPAPWIHYATGSSEGGAAGALWTACAPVHLGRSPVGVLILEGGVAPQEEMLATAMDYASTAAIHLAPALTRTREASERRRAVLESLRPGAFEPVFQPVIDLRNSSVVGFEALTRLTDGRPILEFLSLANDARMRAETEMTLFRAAVREAAKLAPGVWLSINLSPSVLIGHAAELARLLEAADREVVVELTEHERIEDYPAVRSAVAQLGESAKISVDDTGSGYASLKHVVDLRPHYLKLDRGWISGLEQDETRQALIAGIVAFCEHTSTELIAEGIEREPELETLESLGVPYGQGYLLGRPAPVT
jgi:EAL domain-containing protein (putative c-di-GMP-specific phosphodiesterase class I)/CheY-like chemotaxis protein